MDTDTLTTRYEHHVRFECGHWRWIIHPTASESLRGSAADCHECHRRPRRTITSCVTFERVVAASH